MGVVTESDEIMHGEITNLVENLRQLAMELNQLEQVLRERYRTGENFRDAGTTETDPGVNND